MKVRAATLVLLLCMYVGLIVLPSVAHAATVTVTWIAPTQYVDGSSLLAADIASTTVEYGSCNGSAFGTKAGQVVESGLAATMTMTTLGPGVYCLRAFVTTTPARGSISSDFSNVVTKTISFPAPKPPTLLDMIVAFLRRLFGHFA